MVKFLIGIVVIAAIVGGLWWSGWLEKLTAMIPFMKPAEEMTTTLPEQNEQQQPVNDLPTAQNDASDEAIDKDTAAIDAELQALSTQSSEVDASLNDKPVTQEY